MKAPAFQFYVKQWLGDDKVMLMSSSARAIHLHFMCIAWQQTPAGTLPDDDGLLQAWAGNMPDWIDLRARWPELKAQVLRAWVLVDGRWTNAGLAREHAKQAERQKENRSNGSKKWNACETPASDTDSAPISRSQRLAAARVRGKHTREEFQEMVGFFHGECVKCGSQEGVVRDHIIPIYQGGSDAISNLQPLCQPCNASKGPDTTDFRLTHLRASAMPEKWLPNAWPTSSSTSSSASSSSSSDFMITSPSNDGLVSGAMCADTKAAHPRRKSPRSKPPVLSRESMIEKLQAKPAFKDLNVPREYDKCDAWCSARGTIISEPRLTNWLFKADIPEGSDRAKSRRPSLANAGDDITTWDEYKQRYAS